jgi:transcriptional regulator with XRE-family HTH domain
VGKLPNPKAIFIANVRALLAEQRLEVQELARRAGMLGPQVSKYLTGKTVPGLEQAGRIADALGVSVAELLSPGRALPERPIDHPLSECARRAYEALRAGTPLPAADDPEAMARGLRSLSTGSLDDLEAAITRLKKKNAAKRDRA